MKNLIVINNAKSPFDTLKESLKPHQRRHKTSALKKLPFEGSGLIVLIYPSLTASKQLELLKSIKSKWPKISVIFSGMPINFKEVIQLFREGLSDYLIEPINASELIAATQRIERQQSEIAFNPSKFNLTNRELEVCKLLVAGFNGKQAAEYLHITPATIKVHKSRVMRKLGVKTLPDLVRVVGY